MNLIQTPKFCASLLRISSAERVASEGAEPALLSPLAHRPTINKLKSQIAEAQTIRATGKSETRESAEASVGGDCSAALGLACCTGQAAQASSFLQVGPWACTKAAAAMRTKQSA